jgi:hypothetical protein
MNAVRWCVIQSLTHCVFGSMCDNGAPPGYYSSRCEICEMSLMQTLNGAWCTCGNYQGCGCCDRDVCRDRWCACGATDETQAKPETEQMTYKYTSGCNYVPDQVRFSGVYTDLPDWTSTTISQNGTSLIVNPGWGGKRFTATVNGTSLRRAGKQHSVLVAFPID